MTARQPRRTRRRTPAASLPRPEHETEAVELAPASTAQTRRTERRRPTRPEHHVTTDYSYVHKDLLMVTAVSLVALAFVVFMALFVV